MIQPQPSSGPSAAAGGGTKGFKNLFRTADGKNYLVTFLLVCSLFLLWGFCSGLLDNLNKHFQNSLNISKFQSGFVQGAFYAGYFLMALPAGMLARRFGYKGGIIIGLGLAAAGAFWFFPATSATQWNSVIGLLGSVFHLDVATATQLTAFLAFLFGLFIIATGLACLETIANPYATVLGPPESGATRINMSQIFNGFGWVSGMYIGGQVILSPTNVVNVSNEKLYVPYLGIGIAVAIMLVIFIFAKVPDLHAEEEFKAEAAGKASKPIAKRAHFTMGVLSQFLYVAAQTGIFSFFINYAVANIKNLSDQSASNLQTIAFALFALGRLTGSAVVGFTKPHKALAAYAVINLIMMVLTMVGGGWTGVVCLMASFFFMSIMFPTIFALSIRGLGEHTKLGASVLVMSIVGGAIMTPLMGLIADKAGKSLDPTRGMRIGFVIPLLCFAVIAVYGALWQKLESKDAAADSGAGKGSAGH
ncbi:MAG: sugar MFS transporter [Verrucomicrobia bacterium]|nr:sugar MFS transporter [Verrucomicrobiota bacterium]